MTITVYVESDGEDILSYDTAERLRKATAAERRESLEAGDVGAIDTQVSARTIAARAPKLARLLDETRPGWR